MPGRPKSGARSFFCDALTFQRGQVSDITLPGTTMRTGTRQGIARGFSQVITRLEDSVQTDGDLLTRFIGEREEGVCFWSTVGTGRYNSVCQRVIGDKELADDAFQAVFLVVARKAHTVHPREALRGWLHGVATRTALRARRAARRRQKRETLVADIPDRPQRQSDTVDLDVRRRLDERLRGFPTTCGCCSSCAEWTRPM